MYRQFIGPDGQRFGSYRLARRTSGYYWVAECPGCLPDGDEQGPFTTADEAIEDANDID
jgi:hypothetical protein